MKNQSGVRMIVCVNDENGILLARDGRPNRVNPSAGNDVKDVDVIENSRDKRLERNKVKILAL